ncbi:MAG: hypothetical protein JF588_01660 [Caulobacterales bacterium]|nr:hypothetical protein [Caulobacterales bacterium]
MAAAKRKTETPADVAAKLADGHYDRLLEDFQAKLDAATEALRRVHEAMRAENTLRS